MGWPGWRPPSVLIYKEEKGEFSMTGMDIILWIVIGAVAGWIAGELMRGRGFGIIGNIIVGIVGAIIGGLIFDAMDIAPSLGILGSLIMSLIGAVILLFVLGLFGRSRAL
jgi:uncharacterized membrane protein YeaQ/YmgE (transglycosylase-associated protein family)